MSLGASVLPKDTPCRIQAARRCIAAVAGLLRLECSNFGRNVPGSNEDVVQAEHARTMALTRGEDDSAASRTSDARREPYAVTMVFFHQSKKRHGRSIAPLRLHDGTRLLYPPRVGQTYCRPRARAGDWNW